MAAASVNVDASKQLPVEFGRDQLARAAQQLGLRLVVLCGSYAKRRPGPESDLDIAVLGCPADEFWE